ncbi:MAG: hypothetical protein PHD05_00720 [Sphaerochaetaceae bacterium]|nr:hypothetical protein [Sphaerochaetaceae bacterium]
MEESLIDRSFIGIILSDEDHMNKGMYKVNVPELQPHVLKTDGIWCKNHTHKFRVSPTLNGICGSYYPLQPGMTVIVKFFANHMESAYIDRIVSDANPESLPLEIVERDEYFQIIRTPKRDNIIAIYEGDENSKNIPRNSIHIYFNKTRTAIVIDETGINIKTADNINVTVGGNCRITTSGSVDLKASGSVNIQSSSSVNISSSGAINMKGRPIKLNCKSISSAATATSPNTLTLSDSDYFKQGSG